MLHSCKTLGRNGIAPSIIKFYGATPNLDHLEKKKDFLNICYGRDSGLAAGALPPLYPTFFVGYRPADHRHERRTVE
jgi:hypothetical protein